MYQKYSTGELDQVVVIKRASKASDDGGGAAVAWATVDTVRAHVRPLSGRERALADRVDAIATHLFVIRRYPSLLESDALEWNGVLYNIRYIPPLRQNRLFMEIQAERGVAQ